jgi:hypothetical protein
MSTQSTTPVGAPIDQNMRSLISPLPWAPRKDTQTNGRLTDAPSNVAPAFDRGRRIAKTQARSATRPDVAIANPSLKAAASKFAPFRQKIRRSASCDLLSVP